MKKLIIMRGLPGSGKSTEAHFLCPATGVIHSADDFFMRSGTYVFDAKLLGEAHKQCRFFTQKAMRNGVETVIVDNTNTQKWEYQEYLYMAEKYGYEVEIKMVGNLTDIDLYAARNKHGVPRETIERMAKRFES